MTRTAGWFTLVACVGLGLYWTTSALVHSEESSKASTSHAAESSHASPAGPVKQTAETGKIVVESTLKGTIEAEETAELFLEAKNWQGPFTVKSAVAHGTPVKKGDIVLELDATKVDQALSDLRLERELADIALRQTQDELPILEKFLPLNLAAADRDKRVAEEDLKRYTDVERDHNKKSAEFQLKSQLQWLEYSREELKQLQKMYRDKDLTEETEEIILKRQRDQIEQLEFGIESMKLQQEREANLDRPRRDQAMKDNIEKQELAWKRAQSTLPLELNQKRLALQKQRIERARTEERFEQLEGDRAAMVMRAPIDGIAYHGQADRGQWNTGISNRLRPHGVLQPREILMTVVAPRRVFLRTDIEEKELHLIKAGQSGHATPVGFPDLKLPAVVKSVSLVPRSAGNYEARLSLEIPADIDTVLPGMVANVKLVVHRNEKAILIPTSAVQYDAESDTRYAYQGEKGASIKTVITIGKSSGGKTEILSGLKSGDEFFPSQP